jgi:putative phage-type endonuclease
MTSTEIREDRGRWLAERRLGLGGSDAAAVAGLSAWTTRLGVWLDKTGQLSYRGTNVSQQWGHFWESTILRWFAHDRGLKIRRVGLLAHSRHDWLRATPDAYCNDGGLVQIKTTSHRQLAHWADGQVPDEAEIQVQHEMAVTGRPHAWVVALVDGRDLLVRKVPRNRALIANLVDIGEAFWFHHVVPRVPPAFDTPLPELAWLRTSPGSVIPLDDDLRRLLAQRQTAKAEASAAEARLNEIKDRIRFALGEAEAAVDPDTGRVVVSHRRGGTFARRDFAKVHPAEAAECTRPADVVAPKMVAERYPDLWAQYSPRVLRVHDDT